MIKEYKELKEYEEYEESDGAGEITKVHIHLMRHS
jgi:hypothetical protein